MSTTNKVYAGNRANVTNKGSYNPGKHKAIFIVPKIISLLTEAEKDDPKTNIQAKLVADLWEQRVHFIHYFEMMEPNGEDEGYETIDQTKSLTEIGTTEFLYQMNKSWAYKKQVDALLEGNLAATHNMVILDENNIMIHEMNPDENIDGFSLHELHSLKVNPKAPGAKNKYRFRAALEFMKEYEKHDFTALLDGNDEPFNPFTTFKTVEGVTLKLKQESSPSAGEFSFIVTGADGQSIVELYKAADELKQASVWKALMKVGGATLTITSVSVVLLGDEAIKFTLALDTADPDYAQGEDATIQLAAPSVIFAAVGAYLESNKVTVTLT